jgi:hypothetical protein
VSNELVHFASLGVDSARARERGVRYRGISSSSSFLYVSLPSAYAFENSLLAVCWSAEKWTTLPTYEIASAAPEEPSSPLPYLQSFAAHLETPMKARLSLMMFESSYPISALPNLSGLLRRIAPALPFPGGRNVLPLIRVVLRHHSSPIRIRIHIHDHNPPLAPHTYPPKEGLLRGVRPLLSRILKCQSIDHLKGFPSRIWAISCICICIHLNCSFIRIQFNHRIYIIALQA